MAPGGGRRPAGGRQAPPPKLNLERQCGSAALDVVLDILASYRAYLSWYQPKTRYRLLYADMHPQPHVATPQDGYARHRDEALGGAVSQSYSLFKYFGLEC